MEARVSHQASSFCFGEAIGSYRRKLDKAGIANTIDQRTVVGGGAKRKEVEV